MDCLEVDISDARIAIVLQKSNVHIKHMNMRIKHHFRPSQFLCYCYQNLRRILVYNFRIYNLAVGLGAFTIKSHH